jgi:hypothetical protein
MFFIGRKVYRMLMAGQGSTASAAEPRSAKVPPMRSSEVGAGAVTQPYSTNY